VHWYYPGKEEGHTPVRRTGDGPAGAPRARTPTSAGPTYQPDAPERETAGDPRWRVGVVRASVRIFLAGVILVEGVDGPYRPLSIRLERAPETGWIAADIARFDGPQEVAIRFHSLCPLEFILAATFRGAPQRSADSEKETSLFREASTAWELPEEN
jgi:hypothetical protein